MVAMVKKSNLSRKRPSACTSTGTPVHECAETVDQAKPDKPKKNRGVLKSKNMGNSTKDDPLLTLQDCHKSFDTASFSSNADNGGPTSSTSRIEQRERLKLEKDRLRRTVFVGNLPPWFSKGSLHKLFYNALKDAKIDSCDCKIESVRLRGAVPIAGGTSKQARKRSSIKHEFAAGEKHSQIGFVVFTSTLGIPTALKLNGYFLVKDDTDTGRHIRVDVCGRQKPSYNVHKSIFIGNLPFSCNEEEVRQVFLQFGNIRNVRLIRDRNTGAVKGIGFVEFENSSSVSLAIRKAAIGSSSDGPQGIIVGDRPLRVKAWKSIKKPKEASKRRLTIGPHQEKRFANVIGSGSKSCIRIPTNLRGAAARKQYIKRAYQKRKYRKNAVSADSSINRSLKKKGGTKDLSTAQNLISM